MAGSTVNLNRTNVAASQILDELKRKEEKDRAAGGKKQTYTISAFEKDAAAVHGEDKGGDVTAFLSLKPPPRVSELPGQDSSTTGQAAQSLTSTGVEINTNSTVRTAKANDFRKARYRAMKLRGEKGYVQLQMLLCVP